MQDYYEILQVHPKAEQETIQTAYEHMRERYDAARFADAADELVEMARRKRDDIERAYAVLGDARRRAEYDEELRVRAGANDAPASRPVSRSAVVQPTPQTQDGTLIDYRPLPPAHGQERPRDFDAQPLLSPQAAHQGGRQAGRSSRAGPVWRQPILVVGVTTFLIVLASLLIALGQGPVSTASEGAVNGGPAIIETPAGQQPPSEAQLANQFEGQISEARLVVQRVPDNAVAWVNLGNALYDSVQILRERLPDSAIYQERLPRWLEASEAYTEALRLEPDNATVRADLAASLCKYGESTNERSYVEQGLDEVLRALQDAPQDARALLNYGVCLVSSDPPRTQDALEQWLAVLDLPGASPASRAEAQMLIQEYAQ